MGKKKILFILILIIACFGITGCQSKNNEKNVTETDVEETYTEEDENENVGNSDEKAVFVITFDSDGGTAVEQIKVNAGEKVSEPAAPTKDGYKFLGWYNGEVLYDFTKETNKNVTLKAKWEKIKTYTVSFDSNGGSKVGSQTVNDGATAKKPSNPTRSGYTFVMWNLNGKAYNFNTKISKNITLKAIWILVPKISENGLGADSEGTVGKGIKLASTNGISGVEIYSSTSENGTYSLVKKVKKENWNNANSTVYAKKGQKLYYKVRTYVVIDSKTYYSGYSNAIEVNNSLPTPKITEGGMGADSEGTFGKSIKLDSTEGIAGVEIYSSTSENGTYTLLKTVKKADWNDTNATVYAKKGQKLYFKVKTYVITDSKTYRSGFSNAIEVNNSLATPKISEGGMGADSEGTVGKSIKLDSVEGIAGVEIYSSTSENGTYTLLKTVKKADWNDTNSTVFAKKGQKLYFKVKTYVVTDSVTYRSSFSNAIEVNNSLATPKISEGGMGADYEGTVGKSIKLESVEGITGVEIYSSTSENGTYTLLKTVKKVDWNDTNATVYAKKGQKLYFKVKTYVITDSVTYRSGFSNSIEISNL